MKPATQHYLIVDGGVVVAKRALGPDQQPDGSWTVPAPPDGATLVTPETYHASVVGEGGRVEERLARLLARAEKATVALRALADRVTALEATAATHGQQIAKGRTDLKALADRVTALEQA